MKEYYDSYGMKLTYVKDDVYKNEYTNDLYIIKNDKPIQLKNPLDGSNLTIGENGFYKSTTDKMQFRLTHDLKFAPLKDPLTGGELIPKGDNIYYSEYSGGNFTYDEKHQVYIPLFIPDLTNEPAHIENGKLVGNTSNRKFPISSDGRVFLPLNTSKNLKTIEEIEVEKKRLFNMSQHEIDQRINDFVDKYILNNDRLNEAQRQVDIQLAEAMKKSQDMINQTINEGQRQIEERQEKVEDYKGMIDKIYKDIPLSQDELKRLNDYHKKGIVKDDDYNKYMNMINGVKVETRKIR